MQAILNIISNPVNSTVPIAAEILKQKGVYDPKRLFGVTTLDVVCLPALSTEDFVMACPTWLSFILFCSISLQHQSEVSRVLVRLHCRLCSTTKQHHKEVPVITVCLACGSEGR